MERGALLGGVGLHHARPVDGVPRGEEATVLLREEDHLGERLPQRARARHVHAVVRDLVIERCGRDELIALLVEYLLEPVDVGARVVEPQAVRRHPALHAVGDGPGRRDELFTVGGQPQLGLHVGVEAGGAQAEQAVRATLLNHVHVRAVLGRQHGRRQAADARAADDDVAIDGLDDLAVGDGIRRREKRGLVACRGRRRSRFRRRLRFLDRRLGLGLRRAAAAGKPKRCARAHHRRSGQESSTGYSLFVQVFMVVHDVPFPRWYSLGPPIARSARPYDDPMRPTPG